MSTLVVWVLLSSGTLRFESPTDTCAAGGQVALLEWLQLHHEYHAASLKWTCEAGAPV
jgi:hypothetical protein